VILDAAQDRYLAVRREQIEALGPWLEGWTGSAAGEDRRASPPPKVGELGAELCRKGILTSAASEGKPVRPQTIVPAAKSAEVEVSRVGNAALLRHGVRFVMAVARTRRQFMRASFETIMCDVRAGRERRAGNLEVDLRYERFLVAVFEKWRCYYSRPCVCLFDSVCLINFLAVYGCFPALIFGVNAEPFQAHCWLQERDVVLNDAVERVGAYTPIMCV